MPVLTVNTVYAVGDKAVLAYESGSRKMYQIVKVASIKSVVPDVDTAGTDIITYVVEVFAPNSANKLRMDALESELLPQATFTTDFTAF